jgi:hypothetical protein
MINRDMRAYNYFTIGEADAYGQPQLSKYIQGSVKMCINTTSQSIQDNIRYKDASYIGLTFDSRVKDTYVIQYGDEKLKVLYVNPKGRYTQVFLKNYE